VRIRTPFGSLASESSNVHDCAPGSHLSLPQSSSEAVPIPLTSFGDTLSGQYVLGRWMACHCLASLSSRC